MKKVERDVPGHFIDAENCNFFIHTDIVADDENDAVKHPSFCVSTIGEWTHGKLNISGLKYELMVFDKTSENPWSEIDSFRTDSKLEVIAKHEETVEKYLE